jgi:hypothetical protein
MVNTGRVYVPSAVEEDGTVVGMGCFSSQETALNVLRSFLKKSHQVPLQRASVAAWDVDVVERFKAKCYGSACGAWIEESAVEAGVIDCGWPPTRFAEQVKDIDEAMRSLRRIAARAEAAGLSATDERFSEKDV